MSATYRSACHYRSKTQLKLRQAKAKKKELARFEEIMQAS